MTGIDLRRRLARIKRTRAGRDPAALTRAAVIYAAPGEDIAPRIAGMVERGEHRRSWPVLAVRADWPAVRATGGVR